MDFWFDVDQQYDDLFKPEPGGEQTWKNTLDTRGLILGVRE